MLKQHRFLIPVILLIVIFFSFLLGWWLSLPRGDELPASIRTGGKRCYNRLRIPADIRIFSQRRCAPVYFGVGTRFELYLIRRRERMDFTAGDAPS